MKLEYVLVQQLRFGFGVAKWLAARKVIGSITKSKNYAESQCVRKLNITFYVP
jgi:hypothetical protein